MNKKSIYCVIFFIYLVTFSTACTKQNTNENTQMTLDDESSIPQFIQNKSEEIPDKSSSASNVTHSEDEDAIPTSESENDTIIYEDVDYQDLADNQEQNDGRYVRISGQISFIENGMIFLPDKIDLYETRIAIHLDQFDEDVSELLKVGDYVIISGKFIKNDNVSYGNPSLEGCHLELYGDEVKALVESNKTDWIKKGEIIKQDYINGAQIYSYDEVARYPEKYQGEVVAFSGTILQVDDRILLLMADDSADQIIYVYYNLDGSGRLLKNDYITVYGKLDGLKEYTTVSGTSEKVPLINAKYIVR